MNWSDVGQWLKANAGPGAALVGSLLSGNVPGAIAAGASLVASATGTSDPSAALAALQADPATLVRLRELAVQDEQNIREHLRLTMETDLKDKQHEHEQTQLTIRTGDTAEDPFVRRTRPAQSWVSLFAALTYVFMNKDPSVEILMLLLALPWTYAGLRQIGKGVDAVTSRVRAK